MTDRGKKAGTLKGLRPFELEMGRADAPLDVEGLLEGLGEFRVPGLDLVVAVGQERAVLEPEGPLRAGHVEAAVGDDPDPRPASRRGRRIAGYRAPGRRTSARPPGLECDWPKLKTSAPGAWVAGS